ncbi:MAG: hypothetical protein Q7K29_01435 [Thermoleophilia bacterium]|nr:hypothetical protein [Thermoleophilia bacterium]
MGMFKDMKGMMENASEMSEQAKQMQADAMAQQKAATEPADPNDPDMQPIQGISVDRYAEITAGLVKNGVLGIEAVNAYAESLGVPTGAWQEVQNGWVARMGQSMAVRTRYGNLYAEYSK